MRRLMVSAGLCLVAVGCGEAPRPFEAGAPVFRADDRTWRLTYNMRDDRSPVWSPAGDSVYYMARSYGHLPATPGILLAVPRDGGVARPILEDVQVAGATRHWLAAPAVSPAGDRIAFADVWNVWQRPLCTLDSVCDGPELAADPRLHTVFLRSRPFAATGPLSGNPALRVDFSGRSFEEGPPPEGADNLNGIHRMRMHPFQRVWGDGFTFRPAWSPDGTRLAYSDGLRILVWDVDAGGPPAPVPGTEDGVWPAWSPDGQWLAFTRLERGDSVSVQCICYDDFGIAVLAEERIVYTGTGSYLTLVRPDGTDRVELGEGEEPAWSPDGAFVYFRDEDRIWRIARSGGAPFHVPHTEGGREPAVSPDGSFLAFAKRNARGTYDLWIVSLALLP